MNINYELRKMRRKLHLNMRQVAEATGISKSTISNIENEVYNSSYCTIKKLEEYYGKLLEERNHEK